MELSDKMELHTGVTIAEFDASAHKVPEQVKQLVQGYPTLVLFPSGQGTPAPVMYKGERDRDVMAAWMEANAPTIQSNKALRDRIKVCLVAGFGVCLLRVEPGPRRKNRGALAFQTQTVALLALFWVDGEHSVTDTETDNSQIPHCIVQMLEVEQKTAVGEERFEDAAK